MLAISISTYFSMHTNCYNGFLPSKNTNSNPLLPTDDSLNQHVAHKSTHSFIQENIVENLHDLNEASHDFLHRLFDNHPHAQLDAYTRKGNELCPEELAYLSLRKTHIKAVLEKKLSTVLTNQKIPTIAFCFSGGGYRAMLATLGFLQGAEETGLLEVITYIASLSGSTWAIALWNSLQQSPENICRHLKEVIHTNLFTPIASTQALGQVSLKKALFGRKISLIDLYGELLHSKLLAPHCAINHLHCHASLFERGDSLPYPIYTSVLEKPTKEYAWMEYTPHEIGSTYLEHFIPSWSFGRKFVAGKSSNRTLAEKLSLLLGIWGSAFSANIREIYTHAYPSEPNSKMQNMFNTITSIDTIGKARLCSAKVRNFTYQIPNSPLRDKRYVTLLDAGLNYNLPLPPLLRPERTVDIIIILDASATTNLAEELIRAQADAFKQDIPFPVIDLEALQSKSCSVFKGKNSSVIIYIPLIKNETYYPYFDPQESCRTGYCRTSNFAYQPDQIDQLTGLTRHIIQHNHATIFNEIKSFIETH